MVKGPLIAIMVKREVTMEKFKIRTWVYSELNAPQILTTRLKSAEELSMVFFTLLLDLVV